MRAQADRDRTARNSHRRSRPPPRAPSRRARRRAAFVSPAAGGRRARPERSRRTGRAAPPRPPGGEKRAKPSASSIKDTISAKRAWRVAQPVTLLATGTSGARNCLPPRSREPAAEPWRGTSAAGIKKMVRPEAADLVTYALSDARRETTGQGPDPDLGVDEPDSTSTSRAPPRTSSSTPPSTGSRRRKPPERLP